MPTLRALNPQDEAYRRADASNTANEMECSRCGARLWFDREASDTDGVEKDAAWFRTWTLREGCPVCDQAGHAKEKQHYQLVLRAHGGWPGEEIRLDRQVVPQPDDLQQGLESRLDGVVRVEWLDGDAQQRGPERHYLLRAQPQVGQEEVMPAIVDVVNHHGTGSFTGLLVEVILLAEDGSTLDQGTARPRGR